MITIIVGGPRTGKTTLAAQIGEESGIPVMHTDDLMDLEWSVASETASEWFDRGGDFVVEGTMAVRALRKWLERNPGRMVDMRVLYLRFPHEILSSGQSSMSAGVDTVISDIRAELDRRVIDVDERW